MFCGMLLVTFMDPQLRAEGSFSVLCALVLNSKAAGTCWQQNVAHGLAAEVKIRPRSKLFICYDVF